jgi:hypothetical protein
MICAVHQPQYLPWPGFFSKLDAADLFILYDDTQYKHDEWQNRNRIKTPQGRQWLTVPVHRRQGALIREIRVDNGQHWTRKHANAIASNLARTPYYRTVFETGEFAAVYTHEWQSLSELNIALIRILCRALGIGTPMVRSSELDYQGKASDALVSLCRAVGAKTYLSGAGGRDYIERAAFETAGLALRFHDYRPSAYPQRFGEFAPGLSVLDMLLNCGPESVGRLRAGRRISET